VQRFEFKFEKVLEWRAARLEKEEANLLRLRKEREELLLVGATIREGVAEAAQVIPPDPGRLTGSDLAMLADYGRSAKLRLKRLAAKIKEADARIQDQTRVVMEADRQKQLLEDLRKSEFEEWTYEYNREIESTAGEMFLARWKRPS
jgi:hypothetical protein